MGMWVLLSNTSMNTIFLQETLQPLGFNNRKITIE